MSARRLTLLVMVSVAVLLTVGANLASARLVRPYLCQITASSVPSASECNLVGNTVPGGPFGAPQGVAVDSAGRVYVSDGANKVVDVFDSSGNFTGQITGTTTPSALFSDPWGVALDDSDNLWVADVSRGNGLIDKFDPSGASLTQGDGEGHWTGAYTRSVALSSVTGHVYVADSESDDLWVLNSDGTFNKDITGPWGTGCCYIYAAADNSAGASRGDIYVSSNQQGVFRIDGAGAPAAFAASASYISGAQLTGTPEGSFGEPAGVTVDAAGNLYVLDRGKGVVDEFDATGVFVGQTSGGSTPSGSLGTPQSVAVSAAGDLYVASQGSPAVVDVFGAAVVLPDVTTGPVSNPRAGSAILTGTVNPDKAGPATCQFVWGTTTAYGQTVACSAPVAEGESPVPVQAELGGLEPNTTYHYRLHVTNANGTNLGDASEDHEFTTPLAISRESVFNVASTSATLIATINPRNVPATYYFQYGTSTSYGTDIPTPPGATVGLGDSDLQVEQHIQGLTAGTVYHYRVVAGTELATGTFLALDGEDHTFTSQPNGSGFALPDGRQWEMVSPPDKHGAPIFGAVNGGGLAQASVNGDAIAYLSGAPTEAEPQGYAESSQNLSRRGPGDWESKDIEVAHGDSATGHLLGNGEEYRLFSSDLSLGVVQPLGGFDPSLSSEASEQTAFLRTDYPSGDVNEPCLASCYRPLVTGKQGYANVPSGTVFGVATGFGREGYQCPPASKCGPEFLGASLDLSRIVLQSNVVALTPGGERGLYEWHGGALSYIGRGALGDQTGLVVAENGRFAARHAISADGSRIIFTGVSAGLEGLLMRDTANGTTVQVAPAESHCFASGACGRFQAASSDGSRVLFTDERRLTEDAGAAPGEPDLYECEMVEEEGKLKCKLSDLTPLRGGEAADVQNGLVGTSEDGSYVYFIADGALAGGAVRRTCGGFSGLSETCNLYVRHDGTTQLIAVLSIDDGPDWNINLGEQTSRVSPNGRWLTFMSQQDLAGNATRDAVSGKPDQEVYLYDASSSKLVCASCNPTGALSHGIDREQKWLAASIPGWSNITLQVGIYQSRYLDDSGRLFFNSYDALAPQDVNGAEDVYEYEPLGIGGCGTSNATYSERSGGCVGLISSGTSAEKSTFVDASEDSRDVFLLTAAKLAPQDLDTSPDVYDAHECTSSSPCFPAASAQPPPCTTGDACKAAPTPQPAIFGAPSSATFSGAGNIAAGSGSPSEGSSTRLKSLTRAQKLARALTACRKKKHKGRVACKRRARARYATKRSPKANNARERGGRG